MTNHASIYNRKQDHIEINLNKDVSSLFPSGFENYRLIHCALPQIDLSDVDISTNVFNIHLDNPLLISSMTGGTEEAAKINMRLAKTAQEFKIAMGVGSQRIGIEDKSAMESFNIRRAAPDILLFANIGAIQLNYSFSVSECKRAVEAIEANGLILHLNPLHEALMADGNTNFKNLLSKIEAVCKRISVPVVVKEVGWGISAEVAKMLFNVGAAGIDVAGAGGTSWSEVERYRSMDPILRETAAGFRGWGIPTAESLESIKKRFPDKVIFASGGLRNGIDVIKALAMGANLGGMAGPFFREAAKSEDELHQAVSVILKQMKIATFVVGAKNLIELKDNKILKIA
jgi:isopentenyl-diphosphate delta-isomerase